MISESGSFIRAGETNSAMTSDNVEKKNCRSRKSPYRRRKSYMENAEKSKIANKNAQEIFMDAINPINAEEKLKADLKFITRGHLDDIAEERCLSKICGYPLCTNVWKDQFGKRMYIIRDNTVYDITYRKLFCSNKCFHAFEIVKSQVPTTPLYLRSTDDPEFDNLQIVFPDRDKLPGIYGHSINISVPGLESSTADLGTSEFLNNKANAEIPTMAEVEEERDDVIGSAKGLDDVDMQEISKQLENFYIKSEDVRQDGKILHPEYKIDSGDNMTSNEKTQQLPTVQHAIVVEQRLKEMMSFESLKLILGETYLRGMLERRHKSYEEFEGNTGMHVCLEADTRYVALCNKLDKEEAKLSADDNADNVAPQKNMPDYEQLLKDVKECTIKVKSFLVGDEEQPEAPKEVNEELSLPMIDSHSVISWRRKIFFDKLNKFLPHHMKMMNLNEKKIQAILKPLIYSLDLSPHNIYFTPSQWSLVCLTFLKMLSIRYEAVAESFLTDGRAHMESITALFDLDNLYLDRLLSYLTELNYVLEKCIPMPSEP